jgi:hypothetical protein
MSEYLYRFDLYLPLKDKNKQPISPRKMLAVKDEIVDRFGGLTMTSIWGNPIYDGFWKPTRSGRIEKDKNSIFTVLAPQNAQTMNFFLRKKNVWRRNLNHKEILITVHEIQAL